MKLYVGTYAKYNAGSLKGAWLDLDDYKNADEFERACRRLHRGERSPEFMFQDVEYTAGRDWERGLYDESAIPRDYWTLKAEFETAAKPAKKLNPVREAFAAALLAEGYSAKEIDEEQRAAAVVVKLTGGEFVAIRRFSIETSHCEGEDEGRGRSMSAALAGCRYFETEEGFKRVNLRAFDQEAHGHVGRRDRLTFRDYKPAITRAHWSAKNTTKICNFYKVEVAADGTAADSRDCVIRMSNAEDYRRMRQGWYLAREDFKKRLNAYWKRFGASKLHTWTYWTEA